MTGKELERLREQKGLTRNELARLLDTSYVTIWRWEQKVTEIKGPVEKALTAVLNQS